jgi:cobalamin biosynthesis Mg chelatase CobN
LKREYGKKLKKTRVKQELEKRIWEKTKKTRVKQGLEKRIWEKTKKTRVKQELPYSLFKSLFNPSFLLFFHILFSSPCLTLVFYFLN